MKIAGRKASVRVRRPDLRNGPSRPMGVKWVSVSLVLYGAQSLAGAIELLPMWLDGVRTHHYGAVPFLWIELALAISALTTAYGLWRQRRWARLPGLVVTLLSMAVLALIAGFGIGEVDGGGAWLRVGVLMLLAIALSAGFLRYLWHNT